MLKVREVGLRLILMGHGVLMLCLGMALFALASIMANPAYSDSEYTIAVLLSAACLLVAGAYHLVLVTRERPHRSVTIYLLAAGVSLACWSVLWLLSSAPFDLRLIDLLAGFHGLFWGQWYLRLAFRFEAYRRKATLLCIFGGTTSFLGIILATQFQLSQLSALTEVAFYAAFVGVQILLITAYLYRECESERDSLKGSRPTLGRVIAAEDSSMLLTK